VIQGKKDDEYRRVLGDEAHDRQTALASSRFVCCGMPKDGGHHEMCSQRPPDEQVISEDQTSLL